MLAPENTTDLAVPLLIKIEIVVYSAANAKCEIGPLRYVDIILEFEVTEYHFAKTKYFSIG
jgi:hypothetical protein